MLDSEMLARVIHADRVRVLERAARDRRLLSANAEDLRTGDPAPLSLPRPAAKQPACGGSAGIPA